MKRVKKSSGSWLDSMTSKRNEGILQDSDAGFTANEYEARKETVPEVQSEVEGVNPGRDREMIVGPNVCAAGVRALREGFRWLLWDFTDARFTSRLMQKVSMIYKQSPVDDSGKRSLLFSEGKASLTGGIRFNIKQNLINNLKYQFNWSQLDSRGEAVLKMVDFKIKFMFVPGGATDFRILFHLSVVSDFRYSLENWRYEPSGQNNGLCAMVWSEYVCVYCSFSEELVVRLPKGVVPGEDESVIMIVGIQFYMSTGPGRYYEIMKGSSVMVLEVF
jgi:hypothetical protein